jgi:transposase-like protein
VEEKRRMVEQTLEPGASVAQVAQANGVNPNLLFLWRRQHREGRLTAQDAYAYSVAPNLLQLSSRWALIAGSCKSKQSVRRLKGRRLSTFAAILPRIACRP